MAGTLVSDGVLGQYYLEAGSGVLTPLQDSSALFKAVVGDNANLVELELSSGTLELSAGTLDQLFVVLHWTDEQGDVAVKHRCALPAFVFVLFFGLTKHCSNTGLCSCLLRCTAP